MSQSTNPAELPISGSVKSGDIELKIESETHKFFQIQDKRLKLLRPLDRDPILREVSSFIIFSSFLEDKLSSASQLLERIIIWPEKLTSIIDLPK